MTLAADKKLFTIDELIAMPDGQNYELVEGHLVEKKPMGAESSCVAALVLGLISAFIRRNPIGWVFGADATYQCFASPKTGRRPDVSFIRRGRLPGDRVPKGAISIPPDLAVEVVSPNDLAYEISEKIDEYLAAGVRLIWVLYPNTRRVEILRADGSFAVLHENQQINGETILPGFVAPVAEFFLPPDQVEASGAAAE